MEGVGTRAAHAFLAVIATLWFARVVYLNSRAWPQVYVDDGLASHAAL